MKEAKQSFNDLDKILIVWIIIMSSMTFITLAVALLCDEEGNGPRRKKEERPSSSAPMMEGAQPNTIDDNNTYIL